MSAKDRNTEKRTGADFAWPVATATKIYAGILVALNAGGFLVAAADTAGLRVIGRSEEQVDNTAGGNGDLLCNVLRGVFLFDNSTVSAIVAADLGKQVFVEDDHTVSKLGGTNKIKAGRFVGFGGDPTGSDTTQVWIDTRHTQGALGSYAGTAATIATANGSDLATTQALANATKVEVNKLITDVANLAAAIS